MIPKQTIRPTAGSCCIFFQLTYEHTEGKNSRTSNSHSLSLVWHVMWTRLRVHMGYLIYITRASLGLLHRFHFTLSTLQFFRFLFRLCVLLPVFLCV